MIIPSDGAWVVAAPFRSHVHHLMDAADVPWQVVAVAADVPPRAIRTLLFGRRGRARPKLQRLIAGRLFDLRAGELRALRREVVSAAPVAADLRLLRQAGLTWERLSEAVALDPFTCRRLANGQLGHCQAMTALLARAAREEWTMASGRDSRSAGKGFDPKNTERVTAMTRRPAEERQAA
ncbi:MAG: hypothetical protein LBM23_05785 [Propionibacteriaceae bacterium]|jgi:hypothetical protein|nr:hypothetical protein [Propionibacteriaceae bacterium]